MDQKANQLKSIIPIIILNWNGEKDTLACLTSFKESENIRYLPIVVDNGSEAESLNKLKEGCSEIFKVIVYLKEDQIDDSEGLIKEMICNNPIKDILFFIENFENYGFAKGNNIGAKIAQIIDSDWVMLLNNDTEIVKNTLTVLDNFIAINKDIVAVTPQIRLFDPNNKIWNCGGQLTYFGSRKYLFADQNINVVPKDGFSLITFITGCALLFQHKKTGLLTEDFFFGEEDYEFSLRLKNNKLKIACVFESIIYHKVGSTIKKNNNAVNNIYLYYINRLINTRNYYSRTRWEITRLLAYLYLPVLLKMNKINLLKSVKLIKNINSYVVENTKVDSVEFMRVINSQL
ncbi:glycosyltransferase family 2 protein [Flavobacterium sp. M31R6]|uniref:glycosyltransferase family 2 protein n=1 Tax=Flavobacterium sp. M31R6 TaxID=2739062 RepID=UPI0015686BA8|nr:glycosyltransferase family 2 protein [Flavobacterium sp. M31R6]QKJ64822.1 glycosyltransferase family 2 protein [Flavobacterium sp. M31R6]